MKTTYVFTQQHDNENGNMNKML